MNYGVKKYSLKIVCVHTAVDTSDALFTLVDVQDNEPLLCVTRSSFKVYQEVQNESLLEEDIIELTVFTIGIPPIQHLLTQQFKAEHWR